MGEQQRYVIYFNVFLSQWNHEPYLEVCDIVIKSTSVENAEKELRKCFREGLIVDIESTKLLE